MNALKAAEDDLRRLDARSTGVIHLAERISTLESSLRSVKSSFKTGDRVSGGDRNHAEDKTIDAIMELSIAKRNYRIASHEVYQINEALDALTDEERYVLQCYYLSPIPDRVEHLCDEFNCGKSKVYALKDDALLRFALFRYGIVDL